MQSPRRSERAVAIVNRHEIKVGLSISTSDKFQLRGQQALDGILLWQSHVNANGGVRVGNISRPVRLIHYDDGSGFSRAQENVLRLIREDKIDVLFGPYSSGLTMAAVQDEVAIIRTRPHWPNSVRVTAAVAAGIASFASQVGKMADGILGPTQWEPHASPSTVVGPSSAWFIDSFQKQFCTEPDYIAAGAFATGLILTECIRQTGSLDDHKLRSIASDLDVRTFYGGFHVDAHNGKQMGHRVLLVEWRDGTKAVLAC